jgi:hypothetical protein
MPRHPSPLRPFDRLRARRSVSGREFLLRRRAGGQRVEEAVDRMELVGHDFFLFIDARTDHPSVVYRRKGWDRRRRPSCG